MLTNSETWWLHYDFIMTYNFKQGEMTRVGELISLLKSHSDLV
jgi:hypothetical protein